MHGKFESRPPLVGLHDEVIRLNGRLKALFVRIHRSEKLNDSERSVLNAVVEADRPPTVPQIGRSLGQPRQLIQRAANSLMEIGLIEAAPNPDHKRAVLLLPTAEGLALKRGFDDRADALVEEVGAGADAAAIRHATEILRAIRKHLEEQLRASEPGRD